mgnify:CR=1 FL=1
MAPLQAASPNGVVEWGRDGQAMPATDLAEAAQGAVSLWQSYGLNRALEWRVHNLTRLPTSQSMSASVHEWQRLYQGMWGSGAEYLMHTI